MSRPLDGMLVVGVEQAIAAAYAEKYLQNPQVSVFIKDAPLALSDVECKVTNFDWEQPPNAVWIGKKW